MFEKISQAAEQMATNVSRRQFLSRLGRVAMATAAVVVGLVALSSDAHADRPPALYCDPATALPGCQGRHVGDICGNMIDGYGKCVESPKGSGVCGCSVKKHGH